MKTMLIVLSGCLLLTACASTTRPPIDKIPPWIDHDHVHFATPSTEEGRMAPDFTLRTTDGKSQVTLSEMRGKPVVLVFGSFT